VSATTLPASDWRQDGFNAQHTRYNQLETAVSRTNVGHLRLAFAAPNIGGSADPVIVGGVGYLANSGCPQGAAGCVQAISAVSGAIHWTVQEGQQTSAPAFAQGRIWVGLEDPQLLGLAISNGATVASPPSAQDLFYNPSAANGIVYAAGPGGQLVAINASAGTARWAVVLGGANGPPAVSADGKTLFVSSGSFVDNVTAATGAVTAAYYLNGFSPSTITVSGSILYVKGDSWDGTTWKTTLFAMSSTTGAVLWNSPTYTGTLPPATFTDPAVANGLVVVGLPGALDAFNATTGQLVWSTTEIVQAPPTVANGVVFVDQGVSLDMFNSSTGALLGRILAPAGGVFSGSPIPADGHLYISSFNGVNYTTTLEAFMP
jgi:outer membrane protein assembly factor BamB